jgi:hypothetical protein
MKRGKGMFSTRRTSAGLSWLRCRCFGACRPGETQGSFREGVFIELRRICMPVHLKPEELEAKEKKFFQDNPDG